MRFIIEINNIEGMQVSMLHGRLIKFLDKDSEENKVYYEYKVLKDLHSSVPDNQKKVNKID